MKSYRMFLLSMMIFHLIYIIQLCSADEAQSSILEKVFNISSRNEDRATCPRYRCLPITECARLYQYTRCSGRLLKIDRSGSLSRRWNFPIQAFYSGYGCKITLTQVSKDPGVLKTLVVGDGNRISSERAGKLRLDSSKSSVSCKCYKQKYRADYIRRNC